MDIDTATKTIGELALEMPTAIGVLEKWKIDYCCHGQRSIAEACTDAGVTPQELLEQIGGHRATSETAQWQNARLEILALHIVDTHHVFTREILDTIQLLSDKVAKRHGPGHPEVLEVNRIVAAMADDLIPHMLKEEQVLFPYIVSLEKAVTAGNEPPTPFFGTVTRPIAMMMNEHEAVGELLVELRGVTKDYTLPEDACLSFRALYERLVDIEQDLHRHIHLENNVLFPRATDLEAGVRPAAAALGTSHAKCGCGCSA